MLPFRGGRAGPASTSCQELQDERRAGCLFRWLSQGNLMLNQDGLANRGFVWEEVLCVSRELDVLREPAWGHLRSCPGACSGVPSQRTSRPRGLDS